MSFHDHDHGDHLFAYVMISMITILILEQVRNEKSSLELQMEACKAEIKMAEMERPLQQVGGS